MFSMNNPSLHAPFSFFIYNLEWNDKVHNQSSKGYFLPLDNVSNLELQIA